MVTSSKKTDVILVGVDGSDSSLDALQWAADQAKLAHASLEVLSAWEWPSVWGREPTWPPGWDPDEQTRKQLAKVVEAVLESTHKLDVRQVVVEGHAAPALVTAAEHADLLVVGRRGHRSVAGVLLGSVSMHCVTHAQCPVVVAHHRLPKAE
jgi:nucleotide-binding universal stress UspA family protein